MAYEDPYNDNNPYSLDENWAKSALSVAAPKNTSWWDADKALGYVQQYAQKGQGNQGDWINWAIRDTEQAYNKQVNTSAINPNSGIAGNPAAGGKYDYEALRSAWLAPGFNTTVQGGQQALVDFIKNNPQFAYGVTVKNDAIFDPQGRFIADLIGDVGGKNSRIFLKGSSNNKPTGPLNVTTSGAAKGGGLKTTTSDPKFLPFDPFATTPPTSPPPPGNLPPTGDPGQSIAPVQDARLTELYNTLMERSKQGLAIDRNDPVIRAQADAYAAQQERARRGYLSDLAEQSGPTANLRGEQRMASERMGQNVGGFEAELMGRELTARRDEIQNALTQMQGLLTTEQTLALQKELALIDDATKRLSINNQNAQFYAGLKQQDKQFAQDMKYKYASLSQQQKQFMLDLGLRWNGQEWERDPANPKNRL